MRTRGQGFVPSPELHAYAQGVMMRLLKGVNLPPSFRPEVHVLATPEFTGECTPDGTLIVSVGLLELLETEDESSPSSWAMSSRMRSTAISSAIGTRRRSSTPS